VYFNQTKINKQNHANNGISKKEKKEKTNQQKI